MATARRLRGTCTALAWRLGDQWTALGRRLHDKRAPFTWQCNVMTADCCPWLANDWPTIGQRLAND
eukprot:3193512-Lingulodinium_polyedra.AAC.1